MTAQKQHLARTFETGTDFFEWVHKKADGTLFPAEVKLSRLPLGEGVVLQALVRDITERKRAEENLQRINIAVESAGDAIGMSTPQGVHFYHNQSFTDLFGYSIEELQKPLGPTIVFADAMIAREVFETIMQGNSWRGEIMMVAKSGRQFPVTFKANAIKDDKGNIIGLIGIFSDITERKQAEELFRSLAANSPVGVYIVQKGKFVYTNPQFQQYSGYREDELLGMEALSLVFPEDRETVRNNAIQMLKGKRIVPYEFRIINKNGEIKWALESVASIQHQGKQATIGSYQDITERKRAEEEFSKKYQTCYVRSRHIAA